MRLTLRTLLAYRDQVLDTKDTELLEQRVRESRTAQSICERIDGLMHNTRLPLLPVDAREFGIDANHVASFLDDAMGHDRLPDMERACLENSALLAEVASSHQILARAIQVPVQVSPAFRQRIIDLKGSSSPNPLDSDASMSTADGKVLRLDGSHDAHRTPHSQAMAAEPPSIETREELRQDRSMSPRTSKELGGSGIELDDRLGTQVPEYLRGTDRQWIVSLLKISLLLVALGWGIVQTVGPWKELTKRLERSTSSSTSR